MDALFRSIWHCSDDTSRLSCLCESTSPDTPVSPGSDGKLTAYDDTDGSILLQWGINPRSRYGDFLLERLEEGLSGSFSPLVLVPGAWSRNLLLMKSERKIEGLSERTLSQILTKDFS